MKNISFIVPLRNQERKIGKIFKALNEVKLGSGKKLSEVIFVDNGSTDSTFSKITDLAQESTLPVSVISYKKPLSRRETIAIGVEASKTNLNIVLNKDLSNLKKELKKLERKPAKRRPPLVSVVMPVYNAEKYLPQAIESILNQTYKRIELIIINDQSTDKSLEIIKKYKRRSRKITILNTERNLNRGGDMCANLGVEKARGKYIARMDADDIATPDRIEKQVMFLESNPRVFLVGASAYVIDGNGKIVGEKLEPTKPADIYRAYATFHPIIHPTAMIRRVFRGKKFSYQLDYHSNNDYYTFFKLICKGYILANLDDKLLYYRIHDRNDTFVHIRKKFINTAKIRLHMISKYNYRPTAKDVAVNIAQAVMLGLLPEKAVKNLYLITKGIVKPRFFAFPLIRRFALSSV